MSTYDGNSTLTLNASDEPRPDTRRVQRHPITTDRAACREDRAQRLRRRDAVEGNELRFALNEARSLRHFRRILAGA